MTLITHVFPKSYIRKNVDNSMSKNTRLIGPFEKQHAKWAQTLLKSERQHLHHIY